MTPLINAIRTKAQKVQRTMTLDNIRVIVANNALLSNMDRDISANLFSPSILN